MVGKDTPVADPALGTKRLCAGCTAKFYDLGKDPIVCPSCDTVFIVPKAPPPRGRGAFARGAYDPNSGPARATAAREEAATAVADEDPKAKDDTEAESEGEDAAGGVPMLEEIDEK